MESLSTLMGKYGEEGDKLIFKILNSGDFKDGVDMSLEAKQLTNKISEKALKYDLTVPFARYVVQHQNEITFPFKRYQIQPVWRADRPQKGRYREFYQCDADVIGSDSLINELELVQMIDEVFTNLKVPVLVKINNRKILSGIAEVIGEKEKIVTITVAIDKLDKIGIEGVKKELQENGVPETAIKKLEPLIEFKGNTSEKLNFLKGLLAGSAVGIKGIEEVEYIFEAVKNCGLSTATCELDITLARGLNYYTGAIFEVKANVGTLSSSICGGGRYDDLTGIFGLPNMSGVGISFGADRIYDVLNELNLYPETVSSSTKLLFVAFNENDQKNFLPMLSKVRKAGINSEIYPNFKADAKKQFTYGESKNIPFVVSVKEGVLTLKNIVTGERDELTIEKIIEKLK